MPRRPVTGDTLFFPAATAYAVFALPASVLSATGVTGALPALAPTAGHAHEMLFGFALAVVAGNQLGAVPVPRLVLLLGLWAVGRVAFLSAPQGIAAAAVNIAFDALLLAHVAPRLLGSAKKLRNQALPLVLAALCAAGIAAEIAPHAGFAADGREIPIVAVLLFALLMLFMGGRVIAPAVAGQFYWQGGKLDARVQPRIEGGLIVAMALAAAAALVREPLFVALSAAATGVAGALSAVRLARWRLWALHGRPDLLCLAAGYGWLALGLLLLAAAFAAGRHQTVALHVITVGSIGTLTLNVMAMTWLRKARQDPARAALPIWGTVLIAAATLARVLAGLGVYDPRTLLLVAASCWSGAFALLLVLFARSRAPMK
jgi:uncharacterized protein involved in response to NO